MPGMCWVLATKNFKVAVLVQCGVSLDHGVGNRHYIFFIRYFQGWGLEDDDHIYLARGLDGVQGNFFRVKGGEAFNDLLGASYRNGLGLNICIGQDQLF